MSNIKVGQIYDSEGEIFVVSQYDGDSITLIYQNGSVYQDELFSPNMEIYGKLLAEYSTWLDAVRSKYFDNEEK